MLSFNEEHEWHKWVPFYVFAYNVTPGETGYSPYELIFGKLAYLPTDTVRNRPVYDIENYAIEIRLRLEKALRTAKNLVDKEKIKRVNKSIDKSNNLNLEVGDLVVINVFNRKKLDVPYKGPYKIIKRLGVNSIIEIGNNFKEVHNNILKKYSAQIYTLMRNNIKNLHFNEN